MLSITRQTLVVLLNEILTSVEPTITYNKSKHSNNQFFLQLKVEMHSTRHTYEFFHTHT